MSNQSINLKEIIDVKLLQKVQDIFSNATGMASITADADGNYITKQSNFTEFCIKYTRGSKEGLKRCCECDLKGGEQSQKSRKESCYFCHAGLMDFAAPIVIDGVLVGSVIGGQVLPQEPDEEKFRKIAAELGINPDEYIRALRKVKIVPEARIRASAELLYVIVNIISKFWYQQWLIKNTSYEFENSLSSISSTINEVGSFHKDISQSQTELEKEIQMIENVAKNIDKVLISIKSISDQIKMLGLNASIEAARVGEAGRGFAVVSNEIHKLSEKSKETVNQISDFTVEINKIVNVVLDLSKETTSKSSKQSNMMEQILQKSISLNDSAHKLINVSK